MSKEKQQIFLTQYSLIRERESHENILINQRTTWYVTIQSVLIATFGFSFQKYYEISEKIYENSKDEKLQLLMNGMNDRYRLFLVMLCLIGILTSIAAYISIEAAIRSQVKARRLWVSIRDDFRSNYSAFYIELPNISGIHETEPQFRVYYGTLLPKFLAIICTALWTVVVIFVILSLTLKWGL